MRKLTPHDLTEDQRKRYDASFEGLGVTITDAGDGWVRIEGQRAVRLALPNNGRSPALAGRIDGYFAPVDPHGVQHSRRTMEYTKREARLPLHVKAMIEAASHLAQMQWLEEQDFSQADHPSQEERYRELAEDLIESMVAQAFIQPLLDSGSPLPPFAEWAEDEAVAAAEARADGFVG